MSIKNTIIGLVFFAILHNRGDGILINLRDIVTKITMAVEFQKGDNILETLKSGNIFSDIMQEYWRH